jgi:hypothetical protein
VTVILSLNLYDPYATINHVNSLAFNRSTSSAGETEALLYIQNELSKEDIKSYVEHFSYIGARKVLMRLTYLIIFSYLIIFRQFLIIVLYVCIKYLSERLRILSLVKEEDSKSIFTIIHAEKIKPHRPLIIISAHYDSFTANLPYRVQNVLFFVFRIILFPYFIATIGFGVWFLIDFSNNQPNSQLVVNLVLTSTISEFIIIILIILLIYNRSDSMGSIDNASGVSIILELAKLIKRNPLENFDALFIWPGAEEWGLIGSDRFLKRHGHELEQIYDLNNSYYINIDMVGSYIGLFNEKGFFHKKKLNTRLNDDLEKSAYKLGVPIVKYNSFTTPKSDHRSFIKFAKKTKTSLEVAYFHSSKDSKHIHSPRDTPEKCSPENLNGCLDICYDTIRTIDSSKHFLKKVG